MKLSELREYVRTQTETTQGELPNATIDTYLREAFNRTIAAENQWPFLQKSWSLVLPATKTKLTLPDEVHQPGIVALYDATKGYRIELRDHATAQQIYGSHTASARPIEFSVWAGELIFWPEVSFEENHSYILHGYRRATDWVSQGDEAEPDADTRLHQPLCHYAIALAYAQQEDEQLEANYMQRWQRDVELARGAIMEPSQDRPLVMGRQGRTAIGNSRYRLPTNVVSIITPS